VKLKHSVRTRGFLPAEEVGRQVPRKQSDAVLDAESTHSEPTGADTRIQSELSIRVEFERSMSWAIRSSRPDRSPKIPCYSRCDIDRRLGTTTTMRQVLVQMGGITKVDSRFFP
jgi:hypothetical protein